MEILYPWFFYLIGALLLLWLGFRVGQYSVIKTKAGKRLEEFEYYPFITNQDNQVEFSADLFKKAVNHLLAHKDPLAAQQLIVVGEQNFVRDTFGSEDLARYKNLDRARPKILKYLQAALPSHKPASQL